MTLFHPELNQKRTFNKFRISVWYTWVSVSFQAKNSPKYLDFFLFYGLNWIPNQILKV